jgi:hypothetical protein
VVRVRRGIVQSAEGGPAPHEWKSAADELDDPTAFNIAEYAFRCNPRATTPVGWPIEDERIYGSFQLGVGTNTAFRGRSIQMAATRLSTRDREVQRQLIVRDIQFLV